MKIEELSVKGVRGLVNFDFKPKGQNVVVSGPNGSGKSALVDAIDFLFTGKMSRLSGKGTGDLSLKDHGKHVDADIKDAVVTATVRLDPSGITRGDLDPAIANKFRASIVLTGPLLARTRRVSFPSPGGCVIGKRPIDLFLAGYTALGATVDENETEDAFVISAPRGLAGTEIFFKLQSVTATETLLMSAVLAEGTTVLKNVAMEPEVTDVALFLRSCGAKIDGIGTSTYVIHGAGGALLSSPEAPHQVIPDRIEAGSYLVLGALCAHDLLIENCIPAHMELPLSILKEAGVPLEITDQSIRITNNTKENSEFGTTAIRTHEYPGFPTDLQAPFTVFFSQASGESVVEEMIFEGRLAYTADLISMGARIDVPHPHRAVLKGPSKLSGRELYTPDLRAGLAYIIAAIVAKGTSLIHNVHYIDRGYENAEKKLRDIGVALERLDV
jgi:UDP-N-acetylglucosamine 1-carboxyvinyltransferase